MFQKLGSLSQQFQKINSEQEQALLRVAFALIILVYFLSTFYTDLNHQAHKSALIFSSGFLAFSALLAHAIFRNNQPSKNRLLLAMVADLGAVTSVMIITGETGTLLFGIYLWVIVGNGIRYGTQSLIRSQILSVLGFSGVILLNDYWSAHTTQAIGLMLTLVLIPLYIYRLLERLNQAVIHAEEANKAKSQFLANMSHEMRTPLNGVIGASDLILETPLNKEQQDLIHTLRNSGQMLLKLIENVLDLSKIESGKLVAETVDFDLHSLINSTVDMFSPQAEKKGLRLVAHFSPETCFQLCGDALHLRQIVINLVGNAIKFTDKGMVELRVSTLNQGKTNTLLKFEVIDTGIGIAPESQQAIFESFAQANASISSKYGGTGLGTTISKQLVEFMGGRMGLYSGVGIGSVFWFELPFEIQPESHIADAMPALEQMQVMGIGIDSAERITLAYHLAGWGIGFEHATSLAQFFSRLVQMQSTQQHALTVLCTPQTIGVDAKEFATHVWKEFSQNNVSLILIDPDLQKNTKEELLEMGYSCLLQTPVDKTLLFNALHGVMATRPAADVISLREHYERRNQERRMLDILVADDNGTNRKIISKILERGGHRVDLVENGEQALDHLENQQYDLAILDMYMPNLGGLEATKIYRVMAGHEPRMPIIILTANATTEARRECEEAGIDAFLTKPIDAISLLDTVAQLTAGHKKANSPETANFSSAAKVGDTALLNENTLRRLESLGGGSDFVGTVIQGFISESEPLLETMRTALLNHEYSTFKELAHTLKGSAGNVGADALFQICREILQLDDAGLQDSASSLLNKAADSFKSSRLALVSYLESPRKTLAQQ